MTEDLFSNKDQIGKLDNPLEGICSALHGFVYYYYYHYSHCASASDGDRTEIDVFGIKTVFLYHIF
jgi:hypothetical protein